MCVYEWKTQMPGGWGCVTVSHTFLQPILHQAIAAQSVWNWTGYINKIWMKFWRFMSSLDLDSWKLGTDWLCMAAANHMPQLKQYCSWMFKREDWEVIHLHKLIEKEYENHTIQMPVTQTTQLWDMCSWTSYVLWPGRFEGRSIELRPVSAVPMNLCQGRTMMFLHWRWGWDLLKKGHLRRF